LVSGLLAGGVLSLGGCLDLDAARERAADAGAVDPPDARALEAPDASTPDASEPDAPVPDGCDPSDVQAVRFWKLALGQMDYVTLRNTSECPIDLGGLRIFTDDLDDVFPKLVGDCEVELPEVRLAAGAEVRVHEDALSGDIDFLEHKLTPCLGDFSYNPVRGGVTYLCNGACAPDTVIDVVVHYGAGLDPPAMRWGQSFGAPLMGVFEENQEDARFRRVASEGSSPDFLASDWRLEARGVYAGFETVIDPAIDGMATPWLAEDGEPATFGTDAVAAVGNTGLALTQHDGDGRSTGLALELPQARRNPSHVSYFVRLDEGETGASFDLQSDGESVIQASIGPDGLGTELGNGTRTEVEVKPGTWHQVELRGLDWAAHSYDLYIDRKLVGRGLPFRSPATGVDRLSLYSTSAGSISRWDELELWQDGPDQP
jgi:hypothetical protein